MLQFGVPALFLLLATLAAALVCEAIGRRLNRQSEGHLRDGSALLTGLLLAMSLPPHAPVWLGVLGAAFAILFGKQIYGGLGQNLFNPAMLARVVLLIAFPVEMTHWTQPSDFMAGNWYGLNIDGLSGATTLGLHGCAAVDFADGFTLLWRRPHTERIGRLLGPDDLPNHLGELRRDYVPRRSEFVDSQNDSAFGDFRVEQLHELWLLAASEH